MSKAHALLLKAAAASCLRLTFFLSAQVLGFGETKEAPPLVQLDALVVKVDRESSVSEQQAPLSVHVTGGPQWERNNRDNLLQAALLAPNVMLGSAFDAVEISIRGVLSTNNTEVGDPAAGFVVDDISYTRPEAAAMSLFDLESVCVLFGPQGTLFGRNTIAGTVLVTTRKPMPEFQSRFSAALESRRGRSADLVLNFPVCKAVAVRGSWRGRQQDGWIPSAGAREAGWRSDSAGRLQLAWTPQPGTEWLVGATLFRQGGSSSVFVLRTPDGNLADHALPADLGNHKVTRGYHLRSEFRHSYGSVDLVYLGALSSSRVAMERVYLLIPLPTPFFVGAQNATQQNLFSQELRLSNQPGERWHWTVGAFFQREDNDVLQKVPLFNLAFWQPKVVGDSRALFGQVKRRVGDRASVLLGLRHTLDRKARWGGQYSLDSRGEPDVRYSANEADRTWHSTDYRLGLELDLAKHVLAYVSSSSGFKSGGFFDGTGDVYYKPEKLEAIEAGVKGSFLEKRLAVGVSAFLYNYRDYQVSNVEQNLATGLIGTVTRNIGSVPIRGFEASATVKLSLRSRLRLGVGHLSGEFKRFRVSGTDALGQVIDRDLSGNRPANAPRWSWQTGYEYTRPLGSWGSLIVQGEARGNSGYFISYDNHPVAPHPRSTWQAGRILVDATLTVQSRSARWQGSVFVRNATDQVVMTGGHGNASGDIAAINESRTVGGKVALTF
ncbi:MAG: TonB-dependent receptor [Opitutaceae bacterium]|nr:TonB-dependent receptor [Opitutaceae bacterium]